MAWSGYIGLGSVAAGAFVELTAAGYARQPWSFSTIAQGRVAGVTSPDFGIVSGGDWAWSTLAFYAGQTGGSPVIVYPLHSAGFGAAGTHVRVQACAVSVDAVDFQTASGASIDASAVASAASLQPIYAGKNPGVEARNGLTLLKRAALLARNNNPRVNAVMSPAPTITVVSQYIPSTAYASAEVVWTAGRFYTCTTAGTTGANSAPTVTTGTATDGGVVWTYLTSFPTGSVSGAPTTGGNFFGWSAGTDSRRGVFGLLGGTPTTNTYSTYLEMKSATIGGALEAFVNRVSFKADCTRLVIRRFESALTSGEWRIIVDGQYATLAPATIVRLGWGYFLVDFTNAGGRKPRDIVIEFGDRSYFGGVDVLATEIVTATTGAGALGGLPLKMAVTGDSFCVAGGLTGQPWNAYPNVLGDYLGIQNVCNCGVGGTGLLVSSGSGTAISRVSDVINFAPDIVYEANGYNDYAFTTAQVQAAELLLLQTIRAALPNAIIFVTGVGSGQVGAASVTARETAKQAAVAQFGDSNTFFIPITNDPNGAWFTGTGNTGTLKGDGIADVYGNTDGTHLTPAGYVYFAQRMRDAILNILAAF